MLRELHISNLAVIADAHIELSAGLNCFTGATGAGKSLVLGALELLLALRGPEQMLRTGAEEARVTGLFEIRSPELRKQIAAHADIALDDDELLLSRRLFATGRTSTTLNGTPITLAMLRQVAEILVDVHGQHDHQFLLKPINQLELLDQFAGAEKLREGFHEIYAQLREAQKRIAELAASRTLRQQQLELYRFQAEEIDEAQLSPGEYEELTSRSSLLNNLEKLKKQSSAAHNALYEADGSVLERLRGIAAILSELSLLDQNMSPISDAAKAAAIQLEEVSFDLSRYMDRLDLDPAELREVEERLTTIHRLATKYGNRVEDVLAYRAQIGKQIAELEKATDDFSSLEKQIEPLTAKLQKLGGELSTKRQAAAKKLCPLVEKELAQLGMEKAKFFVSFLSHNASDASPTGLDQIEFTIQTNPGLSPQPLRKIASGGELSRTMLALKSILSQTDRVSVLVFDEIDANIGARLGVAIATKLKNLAKSQQVLCITHLPQIAAAADRHLTVHKSSSDDRTQSRVSLVTGDTRLAEIAEMIGGSQVTEATRAQARELIEHATERRKPDKVTKT
ncbi:MAG TPA: DNA repair protein RecN [Tepidisphaeraceae bacterium]|jgi:DNA repair protein RecN (Recombination protein N)